MSQKCTGRKFSKITISWSGKFFHFEYITETFTVFSIRPRAPFLLVQFSIICLRSHVGVREANFVIFADLRFLSSGAPTCDRRQIIDKSTSKNGAFRCVKKLKKFQLCSLRQKTFRTEKY